jgi:hypothetical protein
MAKGESGVWSGTTARRVKPGAWRYTFTIDGVTAIDSREAAKIPKYNSTLKLFWWGWGETDIARAQWTRRHREAQVAGGAHRHARDSGRPHLGELAAVLVRSGAEVVPLMPGAWT